MKKKKNKFAPAIFIIIILLAIFAVVEHFHIKNFQTVKPDVLYTSGQPRGMDYTRLLYKYHIATFINLRAPDEHREHNWYNEEVTWMRENGANYIDLPVDRYGDTPSLPNEETIAKFLSIISDPENLPVLIHDSSGEKRVSALAGAWMIKAGGYSLEETIEMVKKINAGPIDANELAFIKSLQK